MLWGYADNFCLNIEAYFTGIGHSVSQLKPRYLREEKHPTAKALSRFSLPFICRA